MLWGIGEKRVPVETTAGEGERGSGTERKKEEKERDRKKDLA